MATTGVIEKEARERRAPVFQHPDQASFCDVFRDLSLEGQADAYPGKSCLNHRIRVIN
jgi:hypothetical protein